MGTDWIPEEVMALVPVWKNFFEGHAGVQFIHRYLAYAVTLLAGVFYYRALRAGAATEIKKIAGIILLTVVVQFALGVLTLVNGVPVLLAILHQTGAFILFGLLLLLLHRLRKR
jgi:cytochrome c oxidase assembly protein subunit 15